MVRNVSARSGVSGYYYAIPAVEDATATELTGINTALAFVLRYVGSQPHGSFDQSNLTVYCDCEDALGEVRYAYEPDKGFVPLRGKNRKGRIAPTHPDLTREIVDAIRSLEAQGITVHLKWVARCSSDETILVDFWAREGADMKFGRPDVKVDPLPYFIRSDFIPPALQH